MNLSGTNSNELIKIDLLEQINANLSADLECLQLRESMLEYSSQTYKMLFDTNPEPVALIRLSDGHLLEANQRFEKLFACTKEEFRVLGIEHFFMQSTKKLQKMAREALRNGNWFQGKLNIKSKDEEMSDIAISASIIKLDKETLIQASMRKL